MHGHGKDGLTAPPVDWKSTTASHLASVVDTRVHRNLISSMLLQRPRLDFELVPPSVHQEQARNPTRAHLNPKLDIADRLLVLAVLGPVAWL